VLFLPQASGAVRSALAQVKPSTEEAARALGKPPGAVLRTVTMPLISPGVGAATALVFLTAMKELPATLMLSPLGFESLAMQVWSSVTEAYFARAATPALLLVLLSCVPLALLLRRVPGEAL
jgi:iron(III) transport system permease protein